MLRPLKVLPRTVPQTNDRPPQENIPSTKAERDRLLAAVREFVAEGSYVPPLPLSELRVLADRFLAEVGIDQVYRDFCAVLINNEIWREQLATVPFERRLLLLPKCLRVEEHCPAPFDEFGLLCKKCGACSIQDLQEEAERLGYAVLVAEGSPIVMAIIETGKIDAIVGVSCLSVLERAFPYMEAAAIPGIALPLLQDDCKDTSVDLDTVWDIVHLTSADQTRRLDLTALRETVDSWFDAGGLRSLLGADETETETERLGISWLACAGKRWRPFLTVAVYQALQEAPDGEVPAWLRRVALAVECFHKASLVHDDIEDGDQIRYGEETLHAREGVPVALNVGDYLLGEGYRMLAESDVDARVRAELVRVAARGHRLLSLGQGDELCWMRRPAPLSALQVLEIFRRKTAPAFEVALRLGALCAGGDTGDELDELLVSFSESLGIAYQIRDDLEDLDDEDAGDAVARRPTLPMALAFERAKGDDRAFLERYWLRAERDDDGARRLRALVEELGVGERCRELLDAYKEDAVRALWKLDNPNLKGLLRRVVGKIFNETRIKGWCNEFEARNAPGSEAGASAAR